MALLYKAVVTVLEVRMWKYLRVEHRVRKNNPEPAIAHGSSKPMGISETEVALLKGFRVKPE